MKEIYLVLCCSGSYDDYRETPVKAFGMHEDAELFVMGMHDRKKKRDEIYEKSLLVNQAWRDANPMARAPRNYPKPEPNFIGPRKSWTAEQKEQLRQVKVWNENTVADLQEKNRAYFAALSKVNDDFVSTLSAQEREDLDTMDSDSHWSVEPIPFE
jgi:hypothetical protein